MSEEIIFYPNPQARAQMAHGFDDHVARLSARPAVQRTAGG